MKKIIGLMSLLTIMSYGVNCMVVNVDKDDSLNVRAGAGINNRAIGVLDYNANNVEVSECRLSDNGATWCHINYNAGEYGVNGWVNAHYLVSTDESVDLYAMASKKAKSESTIQNVQVADESNNLATTTNELNEAIELYYYQENKEKEALSKFIDLSNHHNVLATAQVAKMYYLGVGVKQDKQLALSAIQSEGI
ncbi:MAG: SH3 domain-containing protein, partial [Sulfurovaceae bacterium]|nr:SH3 domain-containing protein [Sulfurovaceae bacterium]